MGEPESSPISEDTPTKPINPYGASKLMTEQMLRDASAAHGLNVGILRYFNVAGADPAGRAGQNTPAATHLIKVAVQAALGLRDSISVFGTDYPTPDGTCIRDYIHVSDLADAHVLALRHLVANGGNLLVNCAYGRGFSVREVLRAVETVVGYALPVIDAPRRAGDPPALVASADRIREGSGLASRPMTAWRKWSGRRWHGSAISPAFPTSSPEKTLGKPPERVRRPDMSLQEFALGARTGTRAFHDAEDLAGRRVGQVLKHHPGPARAFLRIEQHPGHRRRRRGGGVLVPQPVPRRAPGLPGASHR